MFNKVKEHWVFVSFLQILKKELAHLKVTKISTPQYF